MPEIHYPTARELYVNLEALDDEIYSNERYMRLIGLRSTLLKLHRYMLRRIKKEQSGQNPPRYVLHTESIYTSLRKKRLKGLVRKNYAIRAATSTWALVDTRSVIQGLKNDDRGEYVVTRAGDSSHNSPNWSSIDENSPETRLRIKEASRKVKSVIREIESIRQQLEKATKNGFVYSQITFFYLRICPKVINKSSEMALLCAHLGLSENKTNHQRVTYLRHQAKKALKNQTLSRYAKEYVDYLFDRQPMKPSTRKSSLAQLARMHDKAEKTLPPLDPGRSLSQQEFQTVADELRKSSRPNTASCPGNKKGPRPSNNQCRTVKTYLPKSNPCMPSAGADEKAKSAVSERPKRSSKKEINKSCCEVKKV